MDEPRVVVVGAGVAGLACARELARRHVPAVVLDRSRDVGGRCATRHVDGRAVDYGTFYLHAKPGGFAAVLDELDPAGRIAGWPSRVREPKLACQPDSLLPGSVRQAHRDGVSVLPRHLARGLDVRLGQEVTAIEEDGPRLRLRLAGAGALEAGAKAASLARASVAAAA